MPDQEGIKLEPGSRRGAADSELPTTPAIPAIESLLKSGDLSDLPTGLPHQYRIESRLGRGGMGEVYLAFDNQLGRQVALKILREISENRNYRRRFEREARSIAGLNHPNIVTLHGIGEFGKHLYLTMEYVAGESLAQRLKRLPALTLPEILDLTIQIATALGAAHEIGIARPLLGPLQQRPPATIERCLQEAITAFDEGRLDAARRLLTRAVAGNGWNNWVTESGRPE